MRASGRVGSDRKSTRLNSSHLVTSHAVFCLKKKKGARTLAVALHDVEPATFERCALIRDWLDDLGVDRVTLLVIPAVDLHPVGDRSSELTAWLAKRARGGEEIAQHGFRHLQRRHASPPRQLVARALFFFSVEGAPRGSALSPRAALSG